MARDPMTIIRALEAKTVANGCTPDEALSAKAKATEMRAKYGIAEPKAEAPSPKFNRAYQDEAINEVAEAMRRWAREEFIRKAQESLKRGQEAAAKVKAEQPKKKEEPKQSFKSIGECAEFYIRHIDGNTYQWVANKVREHFPDAKTSAASIAWYANKMKKDGRL